MKVCMIIIFKMQTFFIGRFFMQPKIHANDRHRPLAVDNRNAFNIFSFFMVYLNASIGVFPFMKRILLGALLGVFLIPRMDRSLLMNGYEAMDKCYVNYIGMLIVDSVHNHPVLRVFCFLLKSQVEDKKVPNLPNFGEQAAYYIDRNSATGSTNNIRRRRWWLAYTLIRNPSLSALRVCEAIMDTPGKSPVDLQEIQCSDSDLKDQPTNIMNCSCAPTCCKDFKSCVPKNLVTNLFAVLVLLSIIICFAGLYTIFPIA